MKLTKQEILHLKRGTVLKAIDSDGRSVLFDYAYMTLRDFALHYVKDFMYIRDKAPAGFNEEKKIACLYDECTHIDIVCGEAEKKFYEAVAWIKKECPKEDNAGSQSLDSVVSQTLTKPETDAPTPVADDKRYVLFRNEEKQLRPFVTKVLVCDGPGTYWRPAIFGCKTALDTRHYVMVGGASYTYCIPYHDNRQHVGNEFNINYYKQ